MVFIRPRACPSSVAGNGVDFAVVCQIAERLRQLPTRLGVGRKTLVKQADGRLHTQVAQIEIKLGQVFRHTQTFVNHGLIGKTANIEIGVLNPLFDAAAGHKQAALQILRAPARRRVDKHLLNLRHISQRNRTQYRRISRHLAPRGNTQRFAG